jgi:hypothetical protein
VPRPSKTGAIIPSEKSLSIIQAFIRGSDFDTVVADFGPMMISMSPIVKYQLSDIGRGTPAGQATSLLISVGMSLRLPVLSIMGEPITEIQKQFRRSRS